jgi:DNA-binding response OmpR family regulator
VKHILWIDDDPLRYGNIRAILDPSTLVVFAHGHAQVAHYVRYLKYDLLILDHDMPMMDGSLVIQQFDFDDVPIVICSCNLAAAQRMEVFLKEKGHRVWQVPVVHDPEFPELIAKLLNEGNTK